MSNSIRPPVLDLKQTPLTDRVAVRSFLIDALSNTVNPMFVLKNHKAVGQIHDCINSQMNELEKQGEQAKRAIKQSHASAAGFKINVTGTFCRLANHIALGAAENDPTALNHSILAEASPARQTLATVVESLLSILTDVDSHRVDKDSYMRLRYYPSRPQTSAPAKRLGAHVDGNLLTLLLSTAPGFQVPNEKHSSTSALTAETVRNYGMPTLSGEFVFLPDEAWSNVILNKDEIIVTLGDEFFTSEAISFKEKSSST